MTIKELAELLIKHSKTTKDTELLEVINGALEVLNKTINECYYCDCDLECDDDYSYGDYDNLCQNCFLGLTD